jgi:dolichyl-phosphate-mannose-protein mannosyltransferase
MTKDRLAPFVWLAYLAVPIGGWGLFPGRPLGGVGAVALVFVCWVWWTRRALPFAFLAVVALIAKIALGGTLLVPRGFAATYFANAEFAPPFERGTEPAGRSVTRTDRRLSFLGVDGDLPVYFFNDTRRFNFYLPTQPTRESLPVSAVWEGWLRVPRTGLWRLYVRAPGGRVDLSLGDRLSVTIPPSPAEWVGYPTLSTGFMPIRIALSIPQGGAREFAAGWTVDGREVPFDEAVIFRYPVSRARRLADRLLRAGSMAFDFVICVWLFGSVVSAVRSAWRGLIVSPGARDALAIGSAAVIVDGLLFAWPRLHRMITLSGGDDWLTYETMARDIGLNGPWMTAGAPLGQGAPFYYQPLYPYFIAASHWLFGDDLFGLFLLQRLFLGVTVIALWRVTAALFGERVGCAGLIAALVIVYEKVAPWSGVVLSELIFVPLVCVWAFALVRLAAKPDPSSAALAGIVGGLATLARSTLMLGWPLMLPLLALALHRRRLVRLAVVVVAAMLAVTFLATARNWVVARRFVLVSTSGSINLSLGNPPPPSLVVPEARKVSYSRLGLDPDVQRVVEYARQSPGPFFEGWRRKAAYSLGSFATLAPDRGRSFFYMAISAIALAGLLVLIARPSWLEGRGPAALIPLALALAHLAGIVIFFPTAYGDRLLLPFYALVAPYVGIALFSAHRVVWNIAAKIMGWVVWTVLLGVTAWWFRGHLPQLNVPLLIVAAAVWSACVFGLPRLARTGALAYSALILGLGLWIVVHGRPDIEHPIRLVMLLIVMSLSAHGFLVARA